MGWCFSKYDSTAEGSDNEGDFSGGNIHPITNNDVLEQKLAEAKRDNKIVLRQGNKGYGILVSSTPKETTALFSRKDPEEVKEFLKCLVTWKEESMQ